MIENTKAMFIWENIGPYHVDRLEALWTQHDLEIRAVQFSRSSNVYEWASEAARDSRVATLFGSDEQARGLALVRRLWRHCRADRRRTVFLCHYERWEVFLVACLLRLSGRRVIAMINSKFDDYDRNIWRELGKTLFVKPYNGALTATRRSRDYLSFLGIARKNIALGYNTLSVQRIQSQAGLPPAPQGAAFAERYFLIIARLVPKKNLGAALQAYAIYAREAARTGRALRPLHILGSGPLEGLLRAEAAELGIAGDVQFHGFVQTTEVSAHLSRALCLILPSTEEQFGLVVVEAMAMGVPPLLSTLAGAADVMIENGINGWLVDPEQPATFAFHMARLANDEGAWRAAANAAVTGSAKGDTRYFIRGVRALI